MAANIVYAQFTREGVECVVYGLKARPRRIVVKIADESLRFHFDTVRTKNAFVITLQHLDLVKELPKLRRWARDTPPVQFVWEAVVLPRGRGRPRKDGQSAKHPQLVPSLEDPAAM